MTSTSREVRFPMEIDMRYGGDNRHLVMPANTKIRCWLCGQEFAVTKKRCEFLASKNGVMDDLPYIKCPYCDMYAHAVHYMEQVEERRFHQNPVKPKARRQSS